jgi:hypothetical protein
VAQGRPTALVVASTSATLCEQAVQVFHGGALRIYTSPDPTGVEVGGAVKNVMAIATGILDGLAARADGAGAMPGLNARAALITRGLAEMTRLAIRKGASPATMTGLAGVGDLLLTCTSTQSRNFSVGRKVALDPTLILAIMAVESGFNPFAQSPVGAQGLMQVMTSVHHQKYSPFGGKLAAFDPVTNLRVGVRVLLACIERAGSVEGGLKFYVGAANLEDDSGYANKVLAEQARLKLVIEGKPVPTNAQSAWAVPTTAKTRRESPEPTQRVPQDS